MSQEDLANAAKLDRTYISQLERVQKSATLTTLDKLAGCLGVAPHRPLRTPARGSPRVHSHYMVRDQPHVPIVRRTGLIGRSTGTIPTHLLMDAVDATHELLDDVYSADLDISAILGLRNLSAFVGELFAAAVARASGKRLELNPATAVR